MKNLPKLVISSQKDVHMGDPCDAHVWSQSYLFQGKFRGPLNKNNLNDTKCDMHKESHVRTRFSSALK